MEDQKFQINEYVYNLNERKYQISAIPVESFYHISVILIPSLSNIYEEDTLNLDSLAQIDTRFYIFKSTEGLIKAINSKLLKKELKIEEKEDLCELTFPMMIEEDLENFKIQISKSKKTKEKTPTDILDMLNYQHIKIYDLEKENKNHKKNNIYLEEENKNHKKKIFYLEEKIYCL